MHLNQMSKHFYHSDWGISKTCILNASTAYSGVEKRWPLILFFTYGNKKKSFDAKSRLYGGWLIKSVYWVLKNAVVWAEDRRQLANKWLRITQNWLFCVVLVVRLRHIQFFRKNRRSFAFNCFVREQLLLALAHLETPIQSTAVYFRAHTRKSMIYHLSRWHRRVSKHRDHVISFDQSTRAIFWAIDKLCGILGEHIFLTVKCSCNIECMLVPLMPKVVSTSR